MMVVHFPVALLPMDTVFQIAAIYFEQERLREVGYYCLLSGVIGSWIAIATGLYDLFTRVLKSGSSIPASAYLHAGLQFAMVMGFTVIFSLEYREVDHIQQLPVWIWITKIFLISVLMTGNYFGGELVLRHVAKEM